MTIKNRKRASDDTVIRIGLLALRLSTALFLLIWVGEKLLAPEIARRVSETFYGVSPSDTSMLIVGIIQGIVVLLFALGFAKTWTYGAVLLMHTVSVFSTFPRLMNPYEPPNHLFWAAVPLLIAIGLLFALRHRDTLLAVPASITTRTSTHGAKSHD
nr:hypothetical protein [uncultured Halomonas sp.]